MFDKLTSNTGTLESRPPTVMSVGQDLEPEAVVSNTLSGKGRMSFIDTLGVCFFSTMDPVKVLAEALSAATGWNFNEEQAELVGRRIVNLARVYNFREGHTRAMEAPFPALRINPGRRAFRRKDHHAQAG